MGVAPGRQSKSEQFLQDEDWRGSTTNSASTTQYPQIDVAGFEANQKICFMNDIVIYFCAYLIVDILYEGEDYH